MAEMTDRAGSTAEHMGQQAQNSDWLDKAIRVGLICYGVVHLLIGVAGAPAGVRRRSEGKPSDKGAMQELAEQPYGEVLVWAIAIGMFLLVHLAAPRGGARATATRKDDKRPLEGSGGLARARPSSTPSSGSAPSTWPLSSAVVKGGSTWTKTVMDWPAGQWIIAAVGLAVDRLRRQPRPDAASPRSYAKHLDAEGKSGQTGKAYLLLRQGRLHRQGHRHRHRRRPDPLRRHHPRRQQVRQPRPGAPQGAGATPSAWSCWS